MIAPKIQLRVTARVWVIDACIAPLGLLLALAARDHYTALLMVLPLGALLLVLQRDRDHRIVQAQERLELATTDPLTGVANRGRLRELLRAGTQQSIRTQMPLCVAILDVDHFKKVNDTHGHAAGDQVLRQVASVLGEPEHAGVGEGLLGHPQSDRRDDAGDEDQNRRDERGEHAAGPEQ